MKLQDFRFKEKPRIRYRLKDDAIRGMNREQYKEASHWIRTASRMIESKINWKVFHRHITDTLVYGNSRLTIEDMIL